MGDIGPHHRTRVQAEIMAAEAGESSSGRLAQTAAGPQGQRVVELATGMHYWDGQRWRRSDPSFDAAQEAFVANRLQFKVSLAAQLNRRGAVTVTTPDGLTIQSTPVGIGLYDPVSGRSALLAEIADCTGTLVASDQVLYQNAFKGISADVVFTISRSTFEQDVLIKERVDPAQWGFDPATARIRIFTELYDVPRPERMRRPIRVEPDQRVRSRMVTPDLVDEVLGFGEFVLSTGQAFRSAEDKAPLLVAKETLVAENRVFLVESLEFAPFKDAFELLPGRRSASLDKPGKGAGAKTDLLAILPSARPSEPAPGRAQPPEVQLAGNPVRRSPGVVIDYIATIGGNLSGATTFQAYTTYFVSGPVNCSGATTIEGGAVFKFKYAAASPYASITLNNTLTCKTSPYRPAIFTAEDDDTAGDDLNGWPGSGHVHNPNPPPIRTDGYAKPALKLNFPTTAATASGLQFRYAQDAIEFAAISSSSLTIASVQILDCIRGVVISGCGCWTGCGATLTVRNSLLARVQFPIYDSVPLSGSLSNCTIDCSVALTDARVLTGSLASFVSRDSIFANVDLPPTSGSSLSGSFNGFYTYGATVPFGTSQRLAAASPFQSGPGGPYYLNPAQGTYPGTPTSFIDAGSTTANVAGLYHHTTSAANGTKEFSSTVDLGFHYPALNTSGQPFDYDGDGIPDIEEDLNGNGNPTPDAGETNWQVSDSGLTATVLLDVFTPLR